MSNAFSRHEFDSAIELVQKLNYEWFSKKKAAFEEEHFYKPDLGVISHVEIEGSPDYAYDEEGEAYIDEYIEVENKITIDLPLYCASYLPISKFTDWGTYPEADSEEPGVNKNLNPDNTEAIASNLVHEICRFAFGIQDISSVEKFIRKSLELISEKIAQLKTGHENDEEYTTILQDFWNRCASKLYKRFAKELTLHEITGEYEDKLKFNLNQKQLASFLYILKESEILFKEGDDKKFIDNLIIFAQKYFYFPLAGKHKRSETVKTLRNKFNDVSSYASPRSEHQQYSALKEVIEMLEKTLLRLKKDAKF